MSSQVSLRGMLRLIRVDTLRRVHNVAFLARWIKSSLPAPELRNSPLNYYFADIDDI